MSLRTFLGFIFIIINWNLIGILGCNRKPQGASGEQSPVDDSFQITIDGNPSSYIPGQVYNISLSCAVNFKFSSFTLVAEAEPNTLPIGPISVHNLTGHFEIIDSAETRFSTQCENMIENSNSNFKNRISVAWIAPTNSNSTCVYIKAAVLQHRNVWFMDDGFLTKQICPEEIDDVNSQTRLVNPCCACDEAKYELVLERRWTRNTHAKYFPKEDWRTRFSELVGASHTFDYRFWAYGSPASLGLQELAEHGATKTLENEIKEHSSETGSIRTIIKAPGIPFRKNVMGTTLATVRVDPRHHLVSFVTKIIPSPDWILGVAGLELCLPNCTWIERKVLNLFPWDVGTDSGPSYMSPDQRQYPADVIRRISSTHPSDYRSPFFDPSGAPMKPMATLYITRKKLYERECEPDDNVPFECATHPWVDWSECSTKCGPGSQYRVRAYKDPSLASRLNCEVVLRQTQRCIGTRCGLQEDDSIEPAQSAECALTPWSPWSPCSKSCGRGFTKRTRDFRNPYARENCLPNLRLDLEQTKTCLGNDCGGSISGSYGASNDNYRFNQYENEPGLMEENSNFNSFDESEFPMPRGRDKSSGRANERWDTSSRLPNYDQPTFGDIDQNGYGIEQKDNHETGYNYPNSNPSYFDSNYPNRNSVDSNFAGLNPTDASYPSRNYDQNNNDEQIPSNGDVYSNQRWIGKTPQSQGGTGDLYNNQDNSFNTFEPNNEDSYMDSKNYPPSYNQEYPSRKATAIATATETATHRMSNSRYRKPGSYTKNDERYPHSRSGYTSSMNNSDGLDGGAEFGEVFDDYGQKTLMTAGTGPDEYTVVQEYCFQKPYVTRRKCPGKKIICNYWFYDAEDRQCKLFTTDNCDENKNKFRSLDACEGTCLRPILNLDELKTQRQGGRRGGSEWPAQFGEPQSQTRPNKINAQNKVRNRNRNRDQGSTNRNYGAYQRF